MSRDEDSWKQEEVEVSGGSTSNITSLSIPPRKFHQHVIIFIDIALVVIFILAVAILVLFWRNDIPAISDYFANDQHALYKLLISILSVIVIFILLGLLITRVCRHVRTWIAYVRYQNIEYSDDLTDVEDGDSKYVTSFEKLQQLSEGKLTQLKSIANAFLENPDKDNWSFSTTQAVSTQGVNIKKVAPVVEFSLKAILLGCPSVGKTSLFHRLLYDQFSEYYMATLGADLGHITLHLFPEDVHRHTMVSVQVWDIAGSERFSELSHIIYKDTSAFFIVVDVANPKLQENALPWYEDVVNFTCRSYTALFYNKIDADDHQSKVDVPELSSLDVFRTSAKTGLNVHKSVAEGLVKATLHEINKILMV